MEWTQEKVLQLIDLYHDHPALWDPNDPDYKITRKKLDAMDSISKEFEVDVAELKKKVNSLLASYRRERRKQSEMRPGDHLSHKTWFGFNSMSFMADVYTPMKDRATSQIFIKEYEDEEYEEVDSLRTDEEPESITCELDTSYQNPECLAVEHNLIVSQKKLSIKRENDQESVRHGEVYNIAQKTYSAPGEKDDQSLECPELEPKILISPNPISTKRERIQDGLRIGDVYNIPHSIFSVQSDQADQRVSIEQSESVPRSVFSDQKVSIGQNECIPRSVCSDQRDSIGQSGSILQSIFSDQKVERIPQSVRQIDNVPQIHSGAQSDECCTFGQLVAHKLRKLDHRTRAIVQHRISGVLLEAELEKYPSVSPR